MISIDSIYNPTYPSPPPGFSTHQRSRRNIVKQTEPEGIEEMQNLSPSTEANRAVAFSVAESVLAGEEDLDESRENDGIDQRIRALERRMNSASHHLSAAAPAFEYKPKVDDSEVKHSRSRSDTYILNTPVESSDSFDLPPPRCMTPLPFKRPSLLPPVEVEIKNKNGMPTLAEISARYPARSKRHSLESIDSFGSFSDPSLPSTPRKSRLPAFLRHGRTNSTSSSISDDVILYSPTKSVSFDDILKTPETYPTLRVTPPSVDKGSLLPTITCTPATALGSATASPLAMLEAQVRDDKIRDEKRRIMFSTLQRRHRAPGVAV